VESNKEVKIMELEEFLKENNIKHRFVEKGETIHTKDASIATGIPLENITKSLVFKDGRGKPFMAVLRGVDRVDKKKLKKAIGSKISLVPFNKSSEYSGYLPGATCPINLKQDMLVVIDQKVASKERCFHGGGKRDRIVELEIRDIIKFNYALIADIAEEKS
jgi:prolyl-tRNA editing enzyme YbaK/EbsC (Cys-tRNA(Pro) deacylase)